MLESSQGGGGAPPFREDKNVLSLITLVLVAQLT